ncbi:hypothetical protein CKAH01_03311 [Colletotrichum kahawae]|uniref:Uncharacterized protein n=1 Tax=Colletotrichum kahawae TaxID=34407 RepID=A0AAD9YTV0_COLKA|nr:hypothetical protein CKAH01_03311 [Colletotrichum kahawae]
MQPRDRTTQTLKGSPWELLLVTTQTLQPLPQPPTTIQTAQKPAETNNDEPPYHAAWPLSDVQPNPRGPAASS